ncbi:Cation transport protein [Teratosphaeria destructans]|uniref:Potassium transport protein n=1 Tax=Teratosphaeria destructans TaxID=418781 RepID=A0A9W7W5N5_9PEZI|nr:Cation transport protein [Teratosphaeria destructans]
MVFEPIKEAARWVRDCFPRRLGKPHFNFITVHYMYMVGMSLATAVILYGDGTLGLDFINALFFAAGSATQSGLNPVNVNDLYLYQQVTTMLVACVCNPIFINTAVVFVRLYWFDRRFKDFTRQIRSDRQSRTRTMSRAKSNAVADTDPSRLEQGVAGRPITVLHETTRPNGMSGTSTKKAEVEKKEFEKKMGLDTKEDSISSTALGGSGSSAPSDEVAPDEKVPEGQTGDKSQPHDDSYLGLPARLSRDIVWADEVPSPNSGDLSSPRLERVPESQVAPVQTKEEENRHIQFVEKQKRNAQNPSGALRIPGPRDFDRGEVPKAVDDEQELGRPQTRNSDAPPSPSLLRRKLSWGRPRSADMSNGDEHTKRAIKINEPDHPGHHKTDDEGTAEFEPDDGSLFQRALSLVKSGLHVPNRSLNISQGRRSIAKTLSSLATKDKDTDPMPYLSWHATLGRNSAFIGLNEKQREELGGIEYRALKTLATILICYFVGFHLLGMVILLPWILHSEHWNAIVRSDGINPVWWGFYTPASMFNDLGFTLTPDSMNSFQQSTVALLLGSFLIIIGNTGFPCMLRFVIWVASLCTKTGTPLWEELRFLLDHPRRCFTLLFPSKATWWLFWVLVLLNGIDLIFFIILDLNDSVVTSLPAGYRVLDGWFQATSTRTAGFSCVNLYYLHPAIQVSYLIMMYISVFPIAISVRRTNVYEEKSLGIWGGEEDTEEGDKSFVGQHLRRQLSFDLWYVFLGFFIIAIVEGSRLSNTNDYAFTMFSVLFEIVSAYGTVGLSLGYPNVDTSFSAQFHVLSKLVIIAMMIRGRHRGLPYALDRAILLPSENLRKKDEAIGAITSRRASMPPEQTGDWRKDAELDDVGLPRQHTSDDRPVGRDLRRGSAATTSGLDGSKDVDIPRKRKHERSRSLGVVASSLLTAGPTSSRYE